MSSGVEDLLATLHRRADVLDLLTDGPHDKSEILAELDVSRSTVDRALRELETYNCVTREDGAFVATLVGRVLLETYDSHFANVDGISRATDVLVNLPQSAPVSPEMLAGAEVLRPEAPAPHLPHDILEDIVTEAEQCYGFSVAMTNTRVVDLLRERAVEGVPIELVFSPAMVAHVRNGFAEPIREAATEGTMDLYENDGLPFGLLIGEMGDRTRVAVVIYGPRSELAGIVHNDTPEAVTWARILYRTHRREATPIDPQSLE